MHKYTEKRIIKIADYESRHLEYSIEGDADSVIEQVSNKLNMLEMELRSSLSVTPPDVRRVVEKPVIEVKKVPAVRSITLDEFRNALQVGVASKKVTHVQIREAFDGNKVNEIPADQYAAILDKLGVSN